jgi:hypothetical protein
VNIGRRRTDRRGKLDADAFKPIADKRVYKRFT